ncbi:carboxypeptidase regulatory-like domain-containing protein [bacterium]
MVKTPLASPIFAAPKKDIFFRFYRYIQQFCGKKLILCIISLTFLIVFCHRNKTSFKNPLRPETGLSISGLVRDSQGPVQGAVVRIQATTFFDTTDSQGQFVLKNLAANTSVTLTAWAAGYYITGGTDYLPGTDSVEFVLTKIHETDHSEYQWISGFSEAGGSGNCQVCHASTAGSNQNLPFDEWLQDAHSQSTKNIRFLTMYTGTDVYGNQSPATRFGYNRDYGSFPLPPNSEEPYYGPGYQLDFPATKGNCAACHAPAAAIDDPYGTDPTHLEGVAAEGIGCDFCHKVWDVKLNPATGMPYDNMPGVLSYEFRRPPEGHQYFAGPYDDVAPGEDTYTPIQTKSQYCAPCHFAKFWDVEIYNSFGEWLDSPYSDPETGQTCQDCHMPPGLTDHFAIKDKGGKSRDPKTIFSHRMPGAMDENLLRNALTMTANTSRNGEVISVQVNLLNDKTGHHVPTDSPLRHLILLVEATDASGDSLTQISGSTLPDWCGQGDPNQGYYAGLPGRAYAKILEEFWTGVSPTGAYWNMTKIVSDNRIAAFDSDQSSYEFTSPANGSASVTVTLLFRRAYKQLSDWKSWDDPDIVMAEETYTLD